MIAIDWLNDWMTHNNDQGVTDTTLHRTQTYNRLYRSDYNYDVHDVEYKCVLMWQNDHSFRQDIPESTYCS